MFADYQNHNYGSIHLTDTIKDIVSHPLHIITAITKPVGKVLTAAYKPLEHTLHQVETHVIQPYLKPLIKPIAQVMPKITIAGHRYDLGGSQTLQKAATGAVAGTAVGGFPYGTIAGALAAGLAKGKPDVAQNLISGAIAGGVVALTMPTGGVQIPGTGMTASEMQAAGATAQQVSEISAAAAAPGGIAANAALMPSVGTIPGTGMTAGEMAAAGASNADISSAIVSAYKEIPGTGMTPSQMMDAGATPQQVSEITQAANAPGGITNPANASLMPSVGDPSTFTTIAKTAVDKGITMKDVSEGIGVTGAALGIAQKTGLLKSSTQTPTTITDTSQVLDSGITGWLNNNKGLAIAIGASIIIGIIILSSGKKKAEV
jgi:hypothetical protein